MAIALDASAYAMFSGSGPFTVNFQCSGTQRLMAAVAVGLRPALGSWAWNSLTFNGATLTQQAANDSAGSNRNVRVATWTLVNPPAGAAYQVSAMPSAGLVAAMLILMSFTGVDQSTPVGNSGTDAGLKAAYSASITTGVANAWLIGGAGVRNGTLSWTPGTGMTEVVDQPSGGSSTDDVSGFGGYRACGAAGSYAFAATASAGTPVGALAAVEIRPAVAGGNNIPVLFSYLQRLIKG